MGLGSGPRPGRVYLAGPPMLVAHRGGSKIVPENTLTGFRRAVEEWEADMLELDVQITRDGVPVVIHDATVDRTTDGTGPVRSHTVTQLKTLDAAAGFRDAEGRPSFAGQGIRVPTLDEVLDAFPRVWINIESKTEDAAAPILETVRRHRAEHRVLVAAEYERWRRGARGHRGPWGASRHHILLFRVLCGLPRAAGYTPRADVLQVPEWWRGRRIVTPRFIEQAHRKNLPVQIWTVDDPADMVRLLEWGADGIQTDRPDLLAAVLHERFGRPAPPGLRGRASGGGGASTPRAPSDRVGPA